MSLLGLEPPNIWNSRVPMNSARTSSVKGNDQLHRQCSDARAPARSCRTSSFRICPVPPMYGRMFFLHGAKEVTSSHACEPANGRRERSHQPHAHINPARSKASSIISGIILSWLDWAAGAPDGPDGFTRPVLSSGDA